MVEILFCIEMAKYIQFRAQHRQKYASNKSCSELNFVPKSSQAHMCIPPQSGARELQRSVCLKSYNVQKWGKRFTLGLNTAKNTHYVKTIFFVFDAYFWQHWALNWTYFSVSVQNNISTISIFRATYLHSRGDGHMQSQTFLYKIQF